MAKKYPRSETANTTNNSDEPAFIAWGDDEASRQEAMKISGQ